MFQFVRPILGGSDSDMMVTIPWSDSSTVDLRNLTSAKSKQLWVLRKYLVEVGVQHEVSIRVKRFER